MLILLIFIELWLHGRYVKRNSFDKVRKTVIVLDLDTDAFDMNVAKIRKIVFRERFVKGVVSVGADEGLSLGKSRYEKSVVKISRFVSKLDHVAFKNSEGVGDHAKRADISVS